MDYRYKIQKFVWKYRVELICFAIGMMVLLFSVTSCGVRGEKLETKPVIHSDSVTTLILFRSPDKKTIFHDFGRRIVKDTFAFFPQDENTYVKRWGKDTSYLVNILDTLRINGKPKLDSITHKPIIVPFLWIYGKDMVLYDCNCNLDSVLRKNKL